MTQDVFETLISARDAICEYCECRDDCDKCIVTRLIDDAYTEAQEDIIDAYNDDEDK